MYLQKICSSFRKRPGWWKRICCSVTFGFFGIVRSAEICSAKRVLLEVALIKLCTPAMETSSDSILDRIRVLEEKLEQGVISGGQERVVYVKEDGQAPAEPTPRPELPNAVPEDVQQVVKNFRPIADEASGMLRTYLKKRV